MAEIDTLGTNTFNYGDERFVSYLPLSHIAGTVRMASLCHTSNSLSD